MQEQNPQLINNLLEQQKNTAYIKELSEDTSENQYGFVRRYRDFRLAAYTLHRKSGYGFRARLGQ